MILKISIILIIILIFFSTINAKESKFFYTLRHNDWLWFHIIGGAILERSIKYAFPSLDAKQRILITTSLAIGYEVYQWQTGEHRNFLDATQDVTGTFLICIIINL